jgi:hypothetical protein
LSKLPTTDAPAAPTGPITFTPDDPLYEVAQLIAGDEAKAIKLATVITDGAETPKLRAELATATTAGKAAIQRADEADAKVTDLITQVTRMEQMCATLQAQASATPQVVRDATEDDGTPIPGAVVPTQDMAYIEPGWASADMFPLFTEWGRDVVLLQGPAGVGKSYVPEQWAARQTDVAYIYINLKTSDPHEFIEYRSIDGNGTTRFDLGPLAQAIAHKGQRKCMVVLDEFDTTDLNFQMRMAQVLEARPEQRKLSTVGSGVLPVGRHIQWVVTANATGLNPASRHRGVVAPPILNRSVSIHVPLPSESELGHILAMASPQTAKDNKRVARGVLRLMTAADRGEIDLDVSLRSGIQACRMYTVYKSWDKAWDRAVLHKIDDPQMRAKASTILAEVK